MDVIYYITSYCNIKLVVMGDRGREGGREGGRERGREREVRE